HVPVPRFALDDGHLTPSPNVRIADYPVFCAQLSLCHGIHRSLASALEPDRKQFRHRIRVEGRTERTRKTVNGTIRRSLLPTKHEVYRGHDAQERPQVIEL